MGTQPVYDAFKGGGFANIATVYSAVFDKPLDIDHQGKGNQAGILALFLAVSEHGQVAVPLASFEICLGQIVQDDFVLEVEKIAGFVRKVIFKPFPVVIEQPAQNFWDQKLQAHGQPASLQ